MRMRLAGQICCGCKVRLPADPNHRYGERWCQRCAPRHRVYMYFFLRNGWFVQFLESDLLTPLPRTVTFLDPQKVVDLAERGGALPDLAARQAMNSAIENGRGGVFLSLTPEQYAKLRKAR